MLGPGGGTPSLAARPGRRAEVHGRCVHHHPEVQRSAYSLKEAAVEHLLIPETTARHQPRHTHNRIGTSIWNPAERSSNGSRARACRHPPAGQRKTNGSRTVGRGQRKTKLLRRITGRAVARPLLEGEAPRKTDRASPPALSLRNCRGAAEVPGRMAVTFFRSVVPNRYNDSAGHHAGRGPAIMGAAFRHLRWSTPICSSQTASFPSIRRCRSMRHCRCAAHGFQR